MSTFDDPEIYRSILESLPTGLCVVDMEKKIVLWSDGAERITGHLRHEVIGHSCIAERSAALRSARLRILQRRLPGRARHQDRAPPRPSDFCTTRRDTKFRCVSAPSRFTTQHGSIIGAVETFEELQQCDANSDHGEDSLNCPAASMKSPASPATP